MEEYYDEYYENKIDTANLEEDDEEDDAWDDSALIAAWDSAVKEYKNFHSIKADNKIGTKSDPISETISTFSNNEVTETEGSVNTIKEDKIESFAKPDISSTLDENEDATTSDFIRKTPVNEQNMQNSSEPKVKERRQIKPQTATRSTSGRDTSYQPQPKKITTTYPSYPHHFPGYYSYPPPSATSSTTQPHSFSEQIKKTPDTQEEQEQEENNLPPTEEATTSYPNTNVHDSYYNGENSAYGWYSNYYPTPPPPPPPPPRPQFYPPHSSDSNIPFSGWRPKPPDMVPPMPGFDDEAFTNLIMAWYYSGYYTGLHHGRRGR